MKTNVLRRDSQPQAVLVCMRRFAKIATNISNDHEQEKHLFKMLNFVQMKTYEILPLLGWNTCDHLRLSITKPAIVVTLEDP